LTGSGKHVLRAGYGIYFGQPFINIPLFMIQQANPTLFATVSYTNNLPPGTTGSDTSSVIPSTGKQLRNSVSAWTRCRRLLPEPRS